LVQPFETIAQPRTGFQVASVHSMVVWSPIGWHTRTRMASAN
jgi:hypothetical protein